MKVAFSKSSSTESKSKSYAKPTLNVLVLLKNLKKPTLNTFKLLKSLKVFKNLN